MFDTMILLTGPVEQPILAEVLRRNNPQLTVCGVETLPDLEALDPDMLARARLIGFVTSTIVPAHILQQLGFGGYNFHPGPPNYPGWVPAHSAIFDGATGFGATAHAMIERVDAGPIIDVELFDIPPHTSVIGLEELAYVQLARLFWRLADTLAARSEPPPVVPIQWSGQKSTRRSFAAMCNIPYEISKIELYRHIGSFGAGKIDLRPAIIARGAETKVKAPRIVPAEQQTAVAA